MNGELCVRRRCAIWKARASANVRVWNFVLLKSRLDRLCKRQLRLAVACAEAIISPRVGVVVMRQDGSGAQYFRVEWTLCFVFCIVT
jgi:hypothetical protein